MGDKIKNFKCSFDNCNWRFNTNYKLERHIKTHTGVRDFKCEKCGKAFANSYGLTAHEKIHEKAEVKNVKHEEEDVVSNPSLKCPRKRCLKLFTTTSSLEEHLKNHDLQHVCIHEGCTKRFPKPSLLKKHLMMHTDERLYKCQYDGCEKGFMTMQKLKRHQMIHENKKEYICTASNCNKRFNCEEYLTVHKRTHQETKALECPKEDCFKHFTCSSTLKVHLQKHDSIRPFKCTQEKCGKSYLTASNLRSHRKVHDFENCSINDSHLTTQDEHVDINDLINLPALDIAIMSKEELVAAAFGEFACNQYMNCCEVGSIHEKASDSSDKPDFSLNTFNELDKERLKDLQEEFVRNIYASSVNTDHSFLPSYTTLPPDSSPKSSKGTFSTDRCESGEPHENKHLCNSDTVMLEPCMELSTGHMEIDGAHLEASSCMPDHVYSNKLYENSSTVNLQDIH